MQLEWDEHFREIVLPAWQEYLQSETQLSNAVKAADGQALQQASYVALRRGAVAAIFLHHFGEIVLRARPTFLPANVTEAAQTQQWVASFCFAPRTQNVINDVGLLGDVADALKHAVLTRRVLLRQVATNDQVLVVASGYGDLPSGEGKFGGVDQVVVKASSGPRALSAVLQNVVDAWRRASGLAIPDIGVA